MVKKETSQSIKTAQTRARILKVATKLLRRYGYQNTSVRQICDLAEVSTGTFYHLFGSKDAIVNEVLLTVNTYFTNITLDYQAESPYRLIDVFVETNMAMYRELTPDIIFSSIFQPPGGNKTMYFENRTNYKFLTEALEGFVSAGKIRADIPVEIMRQEILDCSFGTFYSLYTKEEMSLYELRQKRILYRLMSTYLTDSAKAVNAPT